VAPARRPARRCRAVGLTGRLLCPQGYEIQMPLEEEKEVRRPACSVL